MFEFRSIDVVGGTLAVGLSGPAPSSARATVIAAHGITASSVSWTAVARALPDDISLVAVDLRGRGASAGLPAPFGMRAHGEDLLRVVEAFSLDDVVAAGHSMGGYVVSMLAVSHPSRVRSLLWVFCAVPVLARAGEAMPDRRDVADALLVRLPSLPSDTLAALELAIEADLH